MNSNYANFVFHQYHTCYYIRTPKQTKRTQTLLFCFSLGIKIEDKNNNNETKAPNRMMTMMHGGEYCACMFKNGYAKKEKKTNDETNSQQKGKITNIVIT